VRKTNYKKEDLINNLTKKTGLSLNYSKKIINDLIELLIMNIKNNDLRLKNLGSFNLVFKKKRIGRNPKTLEKFEISARKSLIFTPSKNLLEKLNKQI
jgi:nucleoid DNA-binding protein